MTDHGGMEKRIERLEDRLLPLADFARSAGELREELAPRVNEAVQALIAALADVEADFQLEDLVYLIKKLMRNVNNLSFALDQFKNLIDFALTAEPLLKTSVPQLIVALDQMERNGVFRILKVGSEVLRQIGTTYSTDDLRQIGDGLVRLVGIAGKWMSPASLDLLERAAELPARVDLDRARDPGIMGLLSALGDPEIRKGAGVMLAFTRGLAALGPRS